MNGWQSDKRWSDRFIPEITEILGRHLIGEPPEEEDQEHNTDLMVLGMQAVRVACRVRTFPYFQQYPNDITIRTGRPSGMKTELAKIVQGWGDYFFYGFSDEAAERLHAWRLIDLGEFRLWFMNQIGKLPARTLPGVEHDNHDGSSSFRSFDVYDLTGPCMVAEHLPRTTTTT